MRFNSPDLLYAWQRTGQWPRIHNAIADCIIGEVPSGPILDLCCSFGLLGERLQRQLHIPAIGVERDEAAVKLGQDAGVQMPVEIMEVNRDTLADLAQVVRGARVTTLVARRALPELFGHDLELGRDFAVAMRDAGVEEVFLEGRRPTPKPTNQLASIHDEVALMGAAFRLVALHGAVARMKGQRA